MSDSIECLVGQLIASVKDLKDEMHDLKVEMKVSAVKVDDLMALKHKGAGILVAVAIFSSVLGWGLNHVVFK